MIIENKLYVSIIDNAFFQSDWAGACWGCWGGTRAAMDWAFILGWRQRPECFNGRTSSLGLTSEHASPFFKPYQLPSSPCV